MTHPSLPIHHGYSSLFLDQPLRTGNSNTDFETRKNIATHCMLNQLMIYTPPTLVTLTVTNNIYNRNGH